VGRDHGSSSFCRRAIRPQRPLDSADSGSSTFRVDSSMKKSTTNHCSPRWVHTSTVKKSAAAISCQCRVRNSFHVVFRPRSGTGSIPCRFRISEIVLRASLCPRFDNALWIRRITPIVFLFCQLHRHPEAVAYLGAHRLFGLRCGPQRQWAESRPSARAALADSPGRSLPGGLARVPRSQQLLRSRRRRCASVSGMPREGSLMSYALIYRADLGSAPSGLH
jgi:hypothetical protein